MRSAIALIPPTSTTASSAAPTIPRTNRRPRRPRLVMRASPEAIAHARDGLHQSRRARVGLDLPAQVLDVGVDRPLVALVLVTLHAVDELGARERVAGPLREREQHPPLGRSETHDDAVAADLVAADVDHQRAAVEAQLGALDRCGLARGAPQDGAHPERELARTERLGD